MAFGNDLNRQNTQPKMTQNQSHNNNRRRSQNHTLDFYLDDQMKRVLGGEQHENKENAAPQRRDRDRNSSSPREGGSGHRGGQRHQHQKPSPDKVKTELCQNLLEGKCDYADKCWFAHGEEELRAPPKTNRNNQNGQNKNRRRSNNNNRRSNGPRNGRGSASPTGTTDEGALPTISEQAERLNLKDQPSIQAAAAQMSRSHASQKQAKPAPEDTVQQPTSCPRVQVNPLTSYPPPPSNVLTRFHFIEPKVGEYEKYQPIIEEHARIVQEEMKWILSVWNKPKPARKEEQ